MKSKKAFRKLSLIYHPDKYEEGAYNENAKKNWLNLQEAYECLMDKEKRRIYDSTMDFEDEIPGEDLPAGGDRCDAGAGGLRRHHRLLLQPGGRALLAGSALGDRY